tara:strand:+ start:460 stop:669 length:210 start_codon:yes stop_codon:yes gene_type:complete
MRRANLQDVATTLSHIASNDLPHIQSRLNHIDIRMEKMETNLSWSMRLMIVLATGGVSLVIGIIVEAVI